MCNKFDNYAPNNGSQGSVGGDVTINNITNNYFPSQQEQQEQQEHPFTNYLREIVRRYAHLRDHYTPLNLQTHQKAVQLENFGFEREDQLLKKFYQKNRIKVQQEQQDGHPFNNLRDVLRTYGDLILFGSPGAGKTSALWQLALDLAKEGLIQDPQANIPIFIRLNRIKYGQDLLKYVQADLEQMSLEDEHQRQTPLPAHRALAPLLPKLLEDGRLTLLWDGLNETPPRLFATTAYQITALWEKYTGVFGGPNNRHVITCRADDYKRLLEEHGSKLLPLTQATLQQLDQETVEQLVLAHLGNEQGKKLLEALADQHQYHLAKLARTPLLLTMLCLVYKGSGVLPNTRGDLLEKFVETRIEWEQERHPNDTDWADIDQFVSALGRLAYAMTESRRRGTSVPWSWARQRLAKAMPDILPERIHAMAQSADLLEPLGDGRELRFTHQLIQEYFAAVALREELSRLGRSNLSPDEDLGPLERYAAPGRRTGWEETLLLLAGLDGDRTLAPALVRRFLAFPLDAARLLHASGDEVDPALLDELRGQALAQLRNRYEPAQTRLTAARALALVGDPRFPVTLEEWRGALEKARAGDHSGYFCLVKPGDYWLGADAPGGADDLPRHRVAFDAPFWIAQLPITRAQWQFWAEADGGVPDPGDSAAREDANEPVADASWAQARAFCHWLGTQLGVAVRLPTEHEWEAAAAGPEGRRYPWGDGWRPDHAATQENRDTRGRPGSMPVGCFPAGVSPCGALDLAGNVWEWTVERPEPHPGEEWPVQRGGSYQSLKHDARCAARSRIDQPDEGLYAGFRVVVELTAETQRAQRSAS